MRTLRTFWFVRAVMFLSALSLAWLQVGPAWAGTARQARIDRDAALRRLESARRASGLAPGLTQTPDAALRVKIGARERAEAMKPAADVRVLTTTEMRRATGRGPLRNPYFNGALPWQRSLRDVNLCDGNLFKSFTDVQVAPARGAGLVLQRTYNSNDQREGAFGIGWGHAYDIRIQEAAAVRAESGNSHAVSVQPVSGAGPGGALAQAGGDDTVNEVPRTDFFGAKHTYHRDADGLYSPPPYMYDEMDSGYNAALVNGPVKVDEDTEKGMDGTVKHYSSVLTLADGTEGNERACDSITDRYGNATALAYGQSYAQPDGSTRKLLTSVTDPVGRSLTFHWSNLGTASDPHYRITEVDAPTDPSTGTYAYRVAYAYYALGDPASGDAPYELKSVTLDPDGLSRTTTYTYTTFTNGYYDASGNLQSATESGLLAGIMDPLGHTVAYQYTPWFGFFSPDSVPGTMGVGRISEAGSGAPVVWSVYPVAQPYSGLISIVTLDSSDPDSAGGQGYATYAVATDQNFRFTDTLLSPGFIQSSGTDHGFISAAPLFHVQYDDSSNVLAATRYYVQNADFNLMGYAYQTQNGSYGQHGNATAQYYTGNRGPFPNQTGTTYYDAGQYFQKQSMTDPNGRTTVMGVGADTAGKAGDPDPNPGDRGQVLWVRDAGYADPLDPNSPSHGRQSTYTYNQYGQKASQTDLNGVVTTYAYGTSGADTGNLVQVVQDPGGAGHLNRTTAMHYDGMGRMLQSTDPAGLTSTFAYNSLGQPMTVVTPARGGVPGETITYAYGGNGRIQSVTDGRGTTAMVYEDEHYGSTANYGDRVYSVSDPVTGTVRYTYAPLGSRKTMTLPGGGTWTYGYTGGYQFPSDEPDKVTEWLSRITDDQGRRVDYVTDIHGGLHYATGDQVYDTGGGVVSYLQTAYHYYNGTYITDAGYHPDGCGLPWMDRMQTTWYGRNAGGQQVQRIVSRNDYRFDNAGQRTQNTVSTQPLDANGDPQTSGGNATLTGRTEAYAYDDLDRLKTVSYGDGETQGYAFDAMGNRLSKNDTAGNTTASTVYTFDAANRLTGTTGAGAATYTSDADGNTTADGSRTNTWDSQNRLVQCRAVDSSDPNTTHFDAYTYGVDGLRRSQSVSSLTFEPLGRAGTDASQSDTSRDPIHNRGDETDYAYDGTMLVREMRRAGGVLTPTTTYLQGPRGAEYRRDDTQAEGTYTDAGNVTRIANKTRWYVYDGLGSVVGEVDPSGNLTSSGTFDVYGAKRAGGTGTATTRQGFVGALGHVSDNETGLVYMRARYYDPNVGRFVSEDPSKDGLNWFAYCDSDPVNYTDTTGKVKSVIGTDIFALLGVAATFYAVIEDTPNVRLGFAMAYIYATIASASFALSLTCADTDQAGAYAAGILVGIQALLNLPRFG